ncbi:MAG: hypothetical protein CMJ75_16115 [Planctomycetaceae bacterium]|nr:hypothetical protein [Planctomycetaceae bacterium]
MDYFAFQPDEVYLSLDSRAVEDLRKSKPFKIESPDHPRVVLTPRPTLGMVEIIQQLSEEGDGTHRTLIMLSICVCRLAGDWSLVLNSWTADPPHWPDLGEDGALESRKAIMRRLVDRDIERIAEKIQQLTQLEEEDKKK